MLKIIFGVAGGILLAYGLLHLLARWKQHRTAAAAKRTAALEAEKKAFADANYPVFLAQYESLQAEI
jgi:hypothetical protein